jgi:hypothetical protein
MEIKHVVREPTLFAGIREPIQSRDELIPRMAQVKEICGDAIAGPLVNIFRFDTPVEGFDSELGYPVSRSVDSGPVRTHTLRKLHFFSLVHQGPVKTLRDTTLQIIEHMNKAGLSQELELMEIYHRFDPDQPDDSVIETRASFLAWPQVYQEQLLRVLGPELTAEIWAGGERITPFTLVDERVAWVAQTIERLKQHADQDQQFDVLSRVALVRPQEDILKYKKIFEESGDVNAILKAQNEELTQGPSGGFLDPPRFEGNVFHLSKVPYNRQAYDQAETHEQTRRAYCFCSLIREATDPQVDSIFCYRAAGWARQFWEPILGVEFKKCAITHSILKGDKFCAWDYYLD